MDSILVINAGSSSVKFEVFAVDGSAKLTRKIKGQIDGIGTRPRLRARRGDGTSLVDREYDAAAISDVPGALHTAGAWLREEQRMPPSAVGHRVVHGGPEYDKPVLINAEVLARLERYVPLAPLHQPHNLAPIRSILALFPDLPQVACFDTAFHRAHSSVADHYAIPQNLHAEGVRRYGFHGLSYEYIASRLPEVAPEAAAGRVVVAHLGSGASMCALSGGRSIESTMGFTALDGLPMGTRPGQIDPGVILYLLEQKKITAAAVQDFLYRDCGESATTCASCNRARTRGPRLHSTISVIGSDLLACWRQPWMGSTHSCSLPASARTRRPSARALSPGSPGWVRF
jgi:acetate kinase